MQISGLSPRVAQFSRTPSRPGSNCLAPLGALALHHGTWPQFPSLNLEAISGQQARVMVGLTFLFPVSQ